MLLSDVEYNGEPATNCLIAEGREELFIHTLSIAQCPVDSGGPGGGGGNFRILPQTFFLALQSRICAWLDTGQPPLIQFPSQSSSEEGFGIYSILRIIVLPESILSFSNLD